MNEREKRNVHHEENHFWKWIAILLIVGLACMFLFRYCSPVNEQYNDFKNKINDGEGRYERDYKTDFPNEDKQDWSINNDDDTKGKYTRIPSDRYQVYLQETLKGLSLRYHCSIDEISKANPGMNVENPNKPIDKGEVINIPPSTSLEGFEADVVKLTNEARSKAGLKPFTSSNAQLNKAAHAKSQDLNDKNYFSHNSPTYGTPFEMMNQFGISYSYAAENIAKGQRTPEEVVKAWLASEGHRRNIMNPQLTQIGVGFVKGNNSYCWTQMFIGK